MFGGETTPLTLEDDQGKTGSGLRYSKRESGRAKRCIIKIWDSSSVEVVVPKGFDRTLIPKIMEEQTDRITHKQEKSRIMESRYKPESIGLKSVGETWQVSYQLDGTSDVYVREHPGYNLHVHGSAHDISGTTNALNRLVNRQAHRVFPGWIEALSSKLGLTYNRLTIRRQKTVWGSCSDKRNINVNQNLLFLPERMVHYVLLHELSHLEQLNHSTLFWDLLETRFKGSRDMSASVRKAESYVPEWAKP